MTIWLAFSFPSIQDFAKTYAGAYLFRVCYGWNGAKVREKAERDVEGFEKDLLKLRSNGVRREVVEAFVEDVVLAVVVEKRRENGLWDEVDRQVEERESLIVKLPVHASPSLFPPNHLKLP